MLKKPLIALTLPLLFLIVVAASLCRGALGSSSTEARRHPPRRAGFAVATAPGTDTFQKMIVENGSVIMDALTDSTEALPGGTTCHTSVPGRRQFFFPHFGV